MRMRKISEKVPTLDDLIQKFLLVKQSQHTGELAMRDYPNIDYELVLGHYAEIEQWVESGRVDCGFLRLPAHHDFDTFSLAEDPLFAVLPEAHPIAKCDCVPLEALCEEPFLFLEKEEKAEISELFARHKLQPHVQLRTVDDYAVMSMVESGLGLSILPGLILRRIPYKIAIRPLGVPASRTLGLALRKDAPTPRRRLRSPSPSFSVGIAIKKRTSPK